MLRAALTAAGVVAATLATTVSPQPSGHRVENHVDGYTILLPSGWHMSVQPEGGVAWIATYPLSATGDLGGQAPRGQTWIWLADGGALWSLPPSLRRIGPVPTSLPPERSYAMFTQARRLVFREAGHEFLAFVKGRPSAAVLGILRSIRFTARGRTLANVPSARVVGRSVNGRPLRAWRAGNPRSRRRILVIGCIHGNECAGTAVTLRLANLANPIAYDLWMIPNLNPDGYAAGVRQNAHGVDLNRNFGAMWKPIGRRGSPQYSGTRPFSEPESREARALILRLQPAITIWFHQPQAIVRAWGRSVTAARRFARLSGAPYRSLPWLNGTAPNWQNHLGQISLVVELPAGPLSRRSADRYARAVLELSGG